MSASHKVLITGASGFVGQHFTREFEVRGIPCAALSSAHCDLTDLDATLTCFAEHSDADVILHLASYQAAGDFPALHPGEQIHRNSKIHLNVLEAWRQTLPQARMIAVGTSCAYPVRDGGLREETYLDGEIHGSVYAYAMTKRLLFTGIRAYNDQYRLNGSYLIPSTMFGEYDDFHQDTAHVCGALINRFCRATRESWPQVEVWGDGSQVRDLMDVKEFVRVVLALMPNLNRDLLNIGPGCGATIRSLAESIGCAAGYRGEIVFDANRYTGVASKFIDASRLEECYGLTVGNDHVAGILRTVHWYERNYSRYQDRLKFDPVGRSRSAVASYQESR